MRTLAAEAATHNSARSPLAIHELAGTHHRSQVISHVPYAYIFDAKSVTRSLQRLEYPHSLSYHARTLAQFVPTTRVYPESTIEECGFPRKSAETSSSSVYSRIFFMGPSAAVFRAAFTVATVTGFSVNTVRSTTLTFGVGTRME